MFCLMCCMEVEKPSTLPIFSQKSRLPVLCTVPAVLVDVFVGTMLVLIIVCIAIALCILKIYGKGSIAQTKRLNFRQSIESDPVK